MALTRVSQAGYLHRGLSLVDTLLKEKSRSCAVQSSSGGKCSQIGGRLPATSNLHQRSIHHTATAPSRDLFKPPSCLPSRFPCLPELALLPLQTSQHSSVKACVHSAGQSASSTFLANAGTLDLQAELDAAVAAVERACQLCLNVRASICDDGELDEGDARLKKQDATPVTVADFGVQALISLGGMAFMLIWILLNYLAGSVCEVHRPDARAKRVER